MKRELKLLFSLVYFFFVSITFNSAEASLETLTPQEHAAVKRLTATGMEIGEAELRVRIEADKEWSGSHFSPYRSLTSSEQAQVNQLMREQKLSQVEAEARVRQQASESYVTRDWEKPNVVTSVRTKSNVIEKILGEDFFHTGQPSFGSWVPYGTKDNPNYLNLGWSGYHIVMKKTSNKRTVSYSCGEDCTAYLPDQCPDGDCRFNAYSTVYRVGENGSFGDRKLPLQLPIGYVKKYDAGSVEQTVVYNSQKIPIARFDEIEAQSKLKFDEAQVTTLIGFDRMGKALKLGHIEEADAPWMFNQPESYYERSQGKEIYRGTVVERIGLSDERGGEWMRYGTIWCQSPEFALTKNSLWSIFKNDKYNFASCSAARGLSSYPRGSAKQFFTGRANSDVSINDLAGGVLKYEIKSDKCGLGGIALNCNGTQYTALFNGQSFLHINTERRTALGKRSKDGIYNEPVEKLLTLNFKGEPNFVGVQTWREWKTNPNQTAVALIVVDTEEEMVARNLKGELCPRGDGYGDGLGPYIDPATGKTFSSNMLEAYACKRFRTSVNHYYVLFPPTVNGREKTNYEKMAIMDQILALMPDQSQTSPELEAGEELGDFLMAIERYNATSDPRKAVNFESMVDLATEEDAMSAEGKVQDLLSDMGILRTRRQDRPSYMLPKAELSTESNSQDQGVGANENEI